MSNSNQLGIRTLILRSIAGGMSAGAGLVISFIVLLVIGALQGLGLIGGPIFEGASVWAFLICAALAGFMWGVGTLKFRPSMARSWLAGIGGFAAVSVVIMLLRWLLGLTPWDPATAFLFGGFAAAFSAVWGMGAARTGYNLVETAGPAVEHDLEAPIHATGAFDPINFGKVNVHFMRTRIIPIVRPLLVPMVFAFGLALLVAGVVLLLGALSGSLGVARIQTDNTSASATNLAGFIMLGDQPVSKLALFAIIAILVLGGVGTLGLGLALLVNALSTQVLEAQKLPPEPVDFTEPKYNKGPIGHTINFFIRLRDFFAEWVSDITGGALRSFNR